MTKENLISKKKRIFPISDRLEQYCKKYNRNIEIPVFYEDLLRFSGFFNIFDPNGKDTLWVRVYYPQFESDDINLSLKKVYTALYSDGSDVILEYLNIDAVDYCTFGNSKPFRVKVRNTLNDNYSYFYVKSADASRIYGLELEHMFSPYNLNFLVYKNSLIEEHIAGIPGDVFIQSQLKMCTESEKTFIAKEFVKFNERCFIRLLGDMRSYNYVIVPTHDFDHVIYKVRAIDFDQQSYEGNLDIYRPQFYEDNHSLMEIVKERLDKTSIAQYKIEERSIVAKRIISFEDRIERLVRCMKEDNISDKDKTYRLKMEIFKMSKDLNFKKSENMGDIMQSTLSFLKRNYLDSKGF